MRKAHAQLAEEADSFGLDLRLGFELTPTPRLLDENLERYRLGDLPAVLMELPFHGSLGLAEALAERIEGSGLAPVIAHPERSEAVVADPGLAAGLSERGWLLQMNATSVLGYHGAAVELTAWRLLGDGRTVELEFDIVNQIHPEGRTAYNVIAEIPGTDKADEVVMLGGHLDSWHAATGATDNAIGCAVTMEAARILMAIGAKPRRTVRVALWSGEEQGLFGSQAYVREHFGMFEQPKPEYAKFAGYINIDTGTGRARAMTVFGPSAAGVVLREALAPLSDLGVLGATTTRSRQRGGTDSTSFNEAGLPGINVTQDPIEYQSYSWHTNLDTYERIVEDDVKKSAIAIAAAVYHLATRDEQLPRFSADDMPRRVI